MDANILQILLSLLFLYCFSSVALEATDTQKEITSQADYVLVSLTNDFFSALNRFNLMYCIL